jgi:hypothetical protein
MKAPSATQTASPTPETTNADKLNWIATHYMDADDAIGTVESNKRAVVSEYDKRLRELDAIKRHLAHMRADDQQLELFDFETALTDVQKAILRNPMKGLE